jgi:O-antigen/teichoic acid export membrane protein
MIAATSQKDTPPAAAPAKFSILSKIAYLLSARFFQEVLQTAFFIYLARVSTATYGEFMMALGMGSILIMVAEFGLNLPFVKLAATSREKLNDVLSQVLLLKAVFFLLACIGGQVFIAWQDYSQPLRRLLLLIGTGVALETFASTFFVVFQVEGRQDLEAKIRTAGTTLGFGYGLVALVCGASPLLIAFFKPIDSITKLVIGAWLLIRRSGFRWLWPTLRKLGALTRLGLVFAIIEITNSIFNKANLFFLQKFGGAEAVGQYSAAWQIVDGISCLVSGLVLQNVLYPMFVRLWNQNRPAVVPMAQNTARWLLILSIPLMFFLWAESDRLIPFIFGKSYTEAIWLLQYLVVTILITFGHNLAVFLLLSMGREKLVLGFYLLGLVINLLFCSLVMPSYPLPGAALAIIITNGAIAVLSINAAWYRMNFLATRDLKQIAGAVLMGVLIYFTVKEFVLRGFVLLFTLLPTFYLGWKWWRSKSGEDQTS